MTISALVHEVETLKAKIAELEKRRVDEQTKWINKNNEMWNFVVNGTTIDDIRKARHAASRRAD